LEHLGTPAFNGWREFIMRRMMILSLVIANVFVLSALVDTAAAWKIQPVPLKTDKFDPGAEEGSNLYP
jgi:hypothetical protein